MHQNSLREKLASGTTVIGLANMYPAAGIIEGMCPGWDFVWVDGQHGQHSYESILHACRAAESVDVDVLVRVPTSESSLLGNYVDLVPAAIMVPMINSAAQAGRVVESVRFPPVGSRSFGGRRAIDLGTRDYYRDDSLVVIAQVETEQSVANAHQIIGTDGIDLLFFGPDDMRIQMGLPLNTPMFEDDRLRAALAQTAEAAAKVGKYCGCVVGAEQDFEKALRMGYRLVVAGGDIVFMRTMAAQRRANLREIIARQGK